jgi:hypothetical protein
VGARECLPSSRESASRNPQIDCTCARNRKPRTTAHRFAFSSALALRQAVLRASFRLAPCFAVTRSCDLPTSKTRDASDRLLPPVRLCVHPHLARSRLATATFAAWAPRRVWALRGLTGGPSVSRRPRPLRRIDNRTRTSNHAYRREASVGVILPTAPVAIEPLTSLSPLPLAVRWARLRVRFERGGSRRGCRRRRLVKGDGSYNLGCLPSTRTLRRIRWPLQPRSRDRIPACATIRPLDDALAPPWAFAGSAPFLYGAARLATSVRAMWSPAFHRRRPLRTRPPFTRAGSSFWRPDRELIWDRTSPADFCNCITTCEH